MSPRQLTTRLRLWHDAPMKPAKAMTIRLSADQAEQLETVATVDNQPVSEVVRAAITEHIENRKKDVRFKDGLKERIERAQRMLDDETV
jgi:predicted transcriptional regulator